MRIDAKMFASALLLSLAACGAPPADEAKAPLFRSDADLPAAIARVYAAKGRPADHPLIVHVASVEMAKSLVREWPPMWIACSRMWCVGAIFFLLLRWTDWFGATHAMTPELRRDVWRRASLTLAVYVVSFTVALRFTSASHVALYLGTSPVWALLAGMLRFIPYVGFPAAAACAALAAASNAASVWASSACSAVSWSAVAADCAASPSSCGLSASASGMKRPPAPRAMQIWRRPQPPFCTYL